jgi:FtsH-binding integral membrane protein
MFENYSSRGAAVVTESGRVIYGADSARRFMTNVYLWMAGAMVITAFAAILTVSPYVAFAGALSGETLSTAQSIEYAMAYSPLARIIFGSSIGCIVLIVAELALIFYLAVRITKMSRASAMVAFFAYATLNGVTLSSIFIIYTASSIATAFLVSAGMFAGMSVFGLVTKKDLSKLGSICIMAVWGVIIASIVNMFVRSGPFSLALSVVTVLLFTGLTAYDTQKLKRMQAEITDNGTDMHAKIAIYGALQLYLDFINMFLALLRIFGRSRD